jgi:hypothetical protein
MTASALAFAFHFDRPIVENLALVDALLALPVGRKRVGDLIERQTYMPLATGKMKKPGKFNWPRLAQTIAKGDVITCGLGSDTASGDGHQVELYFNCIALANREQSDYYLDRAHRFRGHLSFGAAVLATSENVDALAVLVMEQFAMHIGLAAGAVAAAPVHADAVAIARCSGGLPGTELSRRCSQLYGASFTFGTFAREPEWGTLLQRRHADAIGGPAAIRAAVDPFVLLEAGDLVYVQVTPYAEALSPTAEAKRAALETLMRPVLDGPSTRQP